MDSRYIRAQALTLTKSHEERLGPLMGISKSIELYGHPNPPIAFSDDPTKVGCVHCALPTSLNKICCRIKLYFMRHFRLWQRNLHPWPLHMASKNLNCLTRYGPLFLILQHSLRACYHRSFSPLTPTKMQF